MKAPIRRGGAGQGDGVAQNCGARARESREKHCHGKAKSRTAMTKLGRKRGALDAMNRAAAVMMRGRGVPPDVVARVLGVPMLKVKRWTEGRSVV